jgi:hypothetical protein
MRRNKQLRAGAYLYLCTLVVGAVFALMLIESALEPAGRAFYRSMGRRVPVPWEQARLIFATAGVVLMALIGWSAVATVRALRSMPRERARHILLEAGETVRWQGRLGMASFSQERAIMAGLLSLGMVPLSAALWWLSTLDVPEPTFQVALTGMFLLILGPMAFTGLWSALFKRNRWLYELTGSLWITDRRLLWCGPTGTIGSELRGDELLGADLIETGSGRGWISLLVKRGGSNGTSIELHGVPEPEKAVFAIRGLIVPVEAAG